MAKMVEVTCACGCKRTKLVRESDIKRGWGKFFSKSCKAIAQERRTGQYAAYQQRQQCGGRNGFISSYEDEADYDFTPGDE